MFFNRLFNGILEACAVEDGRFVRCSNGFIVFKDPNEKSWVITMATKFLESFLGVLFMPECASPNSGQLISASRLLLQADSVQSKDGEVNALVDGEKHCIGTPMTVSRVVLTDVSDTQLVFLGLVEAEGYLGGCIVSNEDGKAVVYLQDGGASRLNLKEGSNVSPKWLLAGKKEDGSIVLIELSYRAIVTGKVTDLTRAEMMFVGEEVILGDKPRRMSFEPEVSDTNFGYQILQIVQPDGGTEIFFVEAS